MRLTRLAPPLGALAVASFLVLGQSGEAFSLTGQFLSPLDRGFRIFNNFSDPSANDNQVPDANFPGAQGAVMAIWKSAVEWGSLLHADGEGDPHQPGDLGSGGANFDFTYQGEACEVGGVDSNTHSAISGSSGGILSFIEFTGSGPWRARYYDGFLWDDGPGTVLTPGSLDIQSAATYVHGAILGLGSSTFPSATMGGPFVPESVSKRSISADDIAGVQALYGAASSLKPVVTGAAIAGDILVIQGSNFDPVDNDIWFTRRKYLDQLRSTPFVISAVPSTAGGTSISLLLPSGAENGDVLVANRLSGSLLTSNAWPYAVPAGYCPPPESYCPASPNSVSPFGGSLRFQGLTSITYGSTTFVADSLPPLVFTLGVFGVNQTNIPLGSGTLCVGSPLVRYPTFQTSAAGSIEFEVDPTTISGGVPFQVGEVWNFQLWYRDMVMGVPTSNLTNGIQLEFCP